MSLPIDKRLLTAQYYLIEQREAVRTRKRQLYEQFRAFALNKLKTHGQPFTVRFRSIDGDPGLKYKEVDMGDEFCLVYGSFDFDPKTNLMTNYIRNEFSGTKTAEDINDLINKTTSNLRQFRKQQQTLDNAAELERIQIERQMQRKVDKILTGIFKGKLGFDDPAFQTLVEMNIALERELQELNTRVAAVEIINSGAEINRVDTNDRGFGFGFANDDDIDFGPARSGTAIIDFLKESFPTGGDPALAVMALGQSEDSKIR